MVMPALLRRAGNAVTAGAISYDTLFNNVISSFHFNGANNSTLFIDSVNERNWTTVGTAVKLSTTSFKFGGSSARFPGSGYFTHPYHQDFDNLSLGSKFTVEFWVNATTMGNSSTSGIFNFANAAGQTTEAHLQRTSGNTFYIYLAAQGANNGVYWTGTTVFHTGWVHVACVCEGKGGVDSLKLYFNGVGVPVVALDMTRNAASANQSVLGAFVGTGPIITFNADCYLDDFRVTKGEARYKADFTPPAEQFFDGDPSIDRYFDNVGSLCHFNEADGTGATGVVDLSGRSWTGTGVTSSLQSKFGGLSWRIDAGQNTSTANTTDFQPGTEPFTLELWCRFDALGTVQTLVSSRESTAGHTLRLQADNTLSYFWGSAAFTVGTVSTVSPLTWYHVAVSRDTAGIHRIFLNGKLEGTTSYTSSMTGGGTSLVLGAWDDSGTIKDGFAGYLDDFRYTVGVGRYMGSFNVPVDAFANEGPSDPYWHLTGFLQHFDGVSGTTVDGLIDERGTPFVLQEGTLNLSNVQKRFGKTSMYCPGTAKATTPSRADWQDLSDVNQFTVEYWWYPTSATGVNISLSCRGSDNAGWDLYPEDLSVVFQGRSSYIQTPANCLTVNAWNHIVAVREAADVFKVYVNGILRVTGNVTVQRGIYPLGFGGRPVSPAYYATGYMDEVRITKGAARYLAEFPIPNRPCPVNKRDVFWGNVSMLTHFDGPNGSATLVDSKVPARTFNAVGGVTLSTTSPLMGPASFQHVYNPSAGAGWTTAGDAAFNLGSEDFTLEVMVSIPSYTGNYQGLLVGDDSAGTRGWSLLVDNTSGGDRLKFAWNVGGTAYELVGTRLDTGTKYCIAVVRRGSDLYMYADGVRVASSLISGSINNAGAFGIGTLLSGGGAVAATSSDFKFDEARITKGVARLVARQKYPWPNS